MDTAGKLARDNCSSGTVVVAGRQSNGRGRLNRKWHSEEGGLYFTIILRPEISLAHSGKICFAASFCLAQTLRTDVGVDARVKWPNDIPVNERKIAGMLSQIHTQGDRIGYLNIGIGLNIDHHPSDVASQATSLSILLNRRISSKWALTRFLNRFDACLNEPTALENIIANWKSLTVTLGRKVKIITNKQMYQGIARDVSDTGALIIQGEDGKSQTILYGDCFHQ